MSSRIVPLSSCQEAKVSTVGFFAPLAAAREVLENEYRVDRERIESDQERALERIRGGRG